MSGPPDCGTGGPAELALPPPLPRRTSTNETATGHRRTAQRSAAQLNGSVMPIPVPPVSGYTDIEPALNRVRTGRPNGSPDGRQATAAGAPGGLMSGPWWLPVPQQRLADSGATGAGRQRCGPGGGVGRAGRYGPADEVVARGDGRRGAGEGGHAAGMCLFRRADGVGGGQAGDQRPAASRRENT